MADNVTITQGSGTTIATDDIGGVHYQRVKPTLGADGTAVDVSAGAGAVGTGTQRMTLASDDPAVTALQIMDDWDESDRAKVNLIVGQAGIAAGAGAVGATVPRMTLASDDPAVTALQIIDDWDESDRAKINPIVGQAGVAAGAGAVGATTQRVTLASDDPGVVGIQRFSQAVEYETVAASQTNQSLGATGATGDYLAGVLVIPATTAAGQVQIKDGSNSAITIFTGGTGSVTSLVPFMVPLGLVSTSGAWQVTTGANVSAIGIGNFT